MTARQKAVVDEMIDSFIRADEKHGFDLHLLKVYQDNKTGDVIIRYNYKRTLVNILDTNFGLTLVDKKGETKPMAQVINNVIDQFKYLEDLTIIKNIR